MNPRGLRDLDPLENHKHPCASHAGVYIGFRACLNAAYIATQGVNMLYSARLFTLSYTPLSISNT